MLYPPITATSRLVPRSELYKRQEIVIRPISAFVGLTFGDAQRNTAAFRMMGLFRWQFRPCSLKGGDRVGTDFCPWKGGCWHRRWFFFRGFADGNPFRNWAGRFFVGSRRTEGSFCFWCGIRQDGGNVTKYCFSWLEFLNVLNNWWPRLKKYIWN